MNCRHILDQPGLFGDATLRCGVSGRVVQLGVGSYAVMTPKNYLYYLRRPDEPATCTNCLSDRQISVQTRQKMSAAKIGNQNARKHRRSDRGDQA